MHVTQTILRILRKDRYFRIKQDSNLQPIEACVPQGSVLRPMLYWLFTSDIPTDPSYVTVTFATALLAAGESISVSTRRVQTAVEFALKKSAYRPSIQAFKYFMYRYFN